MVKFKAWNASNSRAIAKFHNAEIGHFGHNTFIHELIRGSLVSKYKKLLIEPDQYHDRRPTDKNLQTGLLALEGRNRATRRRHDQREFQGHREW